MCGIAGAWFTDGAPEMTGAVEAIAHRGPDSRGRYLDPETGVALGHARLAILDLSEAGHQPMRSEDGQVVLVFNGEIYNFRELRAELESLGATFNGHSDTEVVLQMYLREGIAMLARLNGIFALAFHDRRSGELLLARDALGVKPLYVASHERGIAFASEIKALPPILTDVAWTLDPESIHRYLSFLWCPGEGTPVREVRKLLPGHVMTIRQGRIERSAAWYELPTRRGVRGRLGRRESVDAVREGLRTAVHRQMVADVPVGAFLSGGLDSSAVVAFAREIAPDVRCFTIDAGGDEAGQTEDLPYARRVASHLGVPLEIVKVDAARMAGDLQAMVAQLDEPLADPAPLNVLYISRLAREQGVKVLLSGAGGDDLFTGYRRHLALRMESAWSWLPAPARSGLHSLAAGLDQRSALGRRMGRLFANAEGSDDERLTGYFAWIDETALTGLYSAQLREAIAGVRAQQPMLDYLQAIPAGPTRLERLLALEQRFFLADHNLTYTDKMSMAAGVEVRVPFLDLDLVELAARIPQNLKQRGTTGKWVLKKAMEPFLPHDVIYRPKTGFGAPLRRWMRHELRELLGDLLSERSLRARGLFDPVAVQGLIAENDGGRRDASYTLLSLMCIEIWCRVNLDDNAAGGSSLAAGLAPRSESPHIQNA
ncbi:MAG: asparagine synthase (glutamine-hydrolyzing) [Pseudomonadota bacterium]|nr:asparagine synthase (glutamine-hydrolyzing) [Pseudomonadota bacterium]